MVLELKSRTMLSSLAFNRPLACHGVQMFVRF